MSTIVGAEHPPMTLYRALLLLGGEWTSSGVVRHLDPALILAEAWVPYRLQRCRDHLAVGRQAPAIAVVGFRLPARRVLYGVSDGLHRTVAHREAGLKVKARIGGYHRVEPAAHVLWKGFLWRREGQGLRQIDEAPDELRPTLLALGVEELPSPDRPPPEEESRAGFTAS
ncbi:hypothetical protein ACQKJ1_25180 [Methylorubrum rhodesianum]|uniref:hypothetical protein n=1 Tax=Methylorubrum rhodesianum TaxID=29427 RepID=UPI003CFCB0B2